MKLWQAENDKISILTTIAGCGDMSKTELAAAVDFNPHNHRRLWQQINTNTRPYSSNNQY